MKLKRINLIIGKKQIIIVGLTLILGVAVYVNYLIGSSVDSKPVDSSKEAGNYGDLQFVSGTESGAIDNEPVGSAEADNEEELVVATQADSIEPVINDNTDTDNYFAQARLDRDESRAAAIEVLKNVYSGGDSTETELAVLAQDAQALSSYVESENRIETVLKAQGFEDVLCYLSESGANVIVKTTGLEQAQAAQIKNALLSEVKIPTENITIVEIK